MDLLITLVVIFICVTCVIIIKMFMSDEKHDLEIQVGKKFRFSIKKHDKE